MLPGVGRRGDTSSWFRDDCLSHAHSELPAIAIGSSGEFYLFCRIDDDHFGSWKNRAGGVGLGLGYLDDLFNDRRRDVAACVYAELAANDFALLADEVGNLGSRRRNLAGVYFRRDDVTGIDFDIDRCRLFLRRGVDFGEAGGVSTQGDGLRLRSVRGYALVHHSC